METYLERLAETGHQLVVISHFPRQRQIENYRDIDIRGAVPLPSTEVLVLEEIHKMTQFDTVRYLSELGEKTCENVMNFPQVRDLLKEDTKFDLFVGELFNIDCFLIFAKILNIPILVFNTCSLMPWANSRIGNPDNPSYIPLNFFSYSDKMSLNERLYNSFSYMYHSLYYPRAFYNPADKLIYKYIPGHFLSVEELVKTTSVILVNSHYSFTKSRPLVPGVVEVAGIHLKNITKLPEVSHKKQYLYMYSHVFPKILHENY